MNLVIEAIIVGFSTLLFGVLISKLPSKKVKNVYYLLFLSGYVTHFVYEWTGANEYFCAYRNYN